MLELIYDKDVTIAGVQVTLELYGNEPFTEAVIVLPAEGALPDGSCDQVWMCVLEAMHGFLGVRNVRVLLDQSPGRSFRWLDTRPARPNWREARADEVRTTGLAWA